jgi:hypothetical protein
MGKQTYQAPIDFGRFRIKKRKYAMFDETLEKTVPLYAQDYVADLAEMDPDEALEKVNMDLDCLRIDLYSSDGIQLSLFPRPELKKRDINKVRNTIDFLEDLMYYIEEPDMYL